MQQNNVKSLTVSIARSQHRHIMGHQKTGLAEIFKHTNVVVDLPGEDDNSEIVTLRGPQDQLGNAVSAVYTRASSIVSKELNYPEWQKRFLLGPKGANLQQLVPKQDRLQIEFEDNGRIFIEGPPEAVKSAHVALSTEIERLSREMASETLKCPIHLHRHLVGKKGSGSKLNDYSINVWPQCFSWKDQGWTRCPDHHSKQVCWVRDHPHRRKQEGSRESSGRTSWSNR